MTFEEQIKDYRQTISNFEFHPYETLDCLHIRSFLQENYSQLTMKERVLLLSADALVLENVKGIKEKLERVYDFSSSKKPHSEWWWHLDKVEQGKLKVTFKITTTVTEQKIK